VLLYDLTSTYFEGEMEQNPKARRGYSRDGRPDCLQLVIALVVTPDGFPLAYEVMNGNTADSTTLRGFLAKIETTYGKARRVWVVEVKLYEHEGELYVLAKSGGRQAHDIRPTPRRGP
jgi:transposase